LISRAVKLTYYLAQPSFKAQHTIRCTSSLVRFGNAVEPSHYLRNILLEMIKSYPWLKASIDKALADSSLLMMPLEKPDRMNQRTTSV
jgi:hypothetical protein